MYFSYEHMSPHAIVRLLLPMILISTIFLVARDCSEISVNMHA